MAPSSCIPLGREFKVADAVLARPERVERGHLVGFQGEVENAQVLCDTLGIAGSPIP